MPSHADWSTSTALDSGAPAAGTTRPTLAASRVESITSVVVSTYDRKRWGDLVECLRSLERQKLPPKEVIVVVDHNPSLLDEATASFPGITVLENRRPRGLAGARNTGVEEAAGSVVAFIDDDARAEPQWLQRLQTCFGDPRIVGAGGALIPLWQNGTPHWFPREFYWVFGCSYTGLPEKLAPVRNPIGANMAVRAQVLREIGGFREGGSEDDNPREIRSRGVVRAGGNVPDDTDLAIRVKKRWPDAVWLYEPRAPVRHSVTPERTSIAYFARRSFEEGDGKARLARLVGAQQGLSSERRQIIHVLPRGILRGLADALHGDPYGPMRSAMIVFGVLATATGFLAGSLAVLRTGRR